MPVSSSHINLLHCPQLVPAKGPLHLMCPLSAPNTLPTGLHTRGSSFRSVPFSPPPRSPPGLPLKKCFLAPLLTFMLPDYILFTELDTYGLIYLYHVSL